MPASRPGKFRLKQRLIARQIERRPERQLIRRLRDPLDLHHQTEHTIVVIVHAVEVKAHDGLGKGSHQRSVQEFNATE